jgi:hypothetical protein
MGYSLSLSQQASHILKAYHAFSSKIMTFSITLIKQLNDAFKVWTVLESPED